MLRKIIQIVEDKCNGCGACVIGCHEGAIGMVNGKAKLLRDDYCDGLGDCLPTCPMNAITFVEREALAYDAVAVQKHMKEKEAVKPLPCGCAGTQIKEIRPSISEQALQPAYSALRQWPIQIQLAPLQASFYENASLLIAADCTAFAYGAFHTRFMKNKITLIGCPKLDMVDYSEKLTAILKTNNIQSLQIVKMEVPCCGGMLKAVEAAIANCGKSIPMDVVTISTDGRIIEN